MQTNATPTTNANSSSMRDLIAQWQRERETLEQRSARERVARQSRGVPPRRIDRNVRPNDWERNAPRFVALPMDRTCHHPLVRCAHKW